MANLNEVHLIGRIGKDPIITQTNEGKVVIKFSLATTDRWKDKITRELKEKTEWHRVVAYNNPRIKEIFEREEMVGALVYVSGSIKYEKWVNKTGVEQKITSIVIDVFSGKFTILARKNKPGTDFTKKETTETNETQSAGYDFDFSNEDDSEEIPF